MKPETTELVKRIVRYAGWGMLIVIGVMDAGTRGRFHLDWPNLALILTGALFCFTPMTELIPKIQSIKIGVVELLLGEMSLNARERKELSGLSSHDVWALNDFAIGKIPLFTERMTPQQRVAARMLVDMKLMTVAGEGAERKVSVTTLGNKLIAAAASIAL